MAGWPKTKVPSVKKPKVSKKSQVLVGPKGKVRLPKAGA